MCSICFIHKKSSRIHNINFINHMIDITENDPKQKKPSMKKLSQLFNKSRSGFCIIKLFLISSVLYLIYLVSSTLPVLTPSQNPTITKNFISPASQAVNNPLPLLYPSQNPASSPASQAVNIPNPLTIHNIVFGIASNDNSWPNRKEYVKLWWRANQTRGCVFLESNNGRVVDDTDPTICVSADTSSLRYTYPWGGSRSAIRVARVVAETVLLFNDSDVRWYVFGDDDTIFFTENLVKTLSKYDDGLWYYVGSNSEIFGQNQDFVFGMAFGGAGFAISYPLARVLSRVFDSCLDRYSHVYGSDSRVFSCVTELGVSLTHEPGFHQVDIRGDIFGFLTSHPLTPLVSLHHLDAVNPIFPQMTTINALKHLYDATAVDSQRILQQTRCYYPKRSWTISLAWGYAVEIHNDNLLLPDSLVTQETFGQWKKGDVFSGAYMFNTKKVEWNPCKRATTFFFDRVDYDESGKIHSYYKKMYPKCYFIASLTKKLEEIKVVSKKLDLNTKQLLAPRRHCCDVLPYSEGKVMELEVRECKEDEMIYMH